jgi:uncharacterized protein
MRPMSLFEAGRSTGLVSLHELLEGRLSPSAEPGLTVVELAEEVARGGWPGLRGRSIADAFLAVRDHLDEIARVDVGRVAAGHRDPSRVARLLASLARNVVTSLRRFAARIDLEKCGNPALLGVIVGTGCGYRREDGVAVIPIGALGP